MVLATCASGEIEGVCVAHSISMKNQSPESWVHDDVPVGVFDLTKESSGYWIKSINDSIAKVAYQVSLLKGPKLALACTIPQGAFSGPFEAKRWRKFPS